MTSKGQVTVPVEVRRALGVEEGDLLVFEVAGAYATLRKRRPTLEVAQEVRSRYLAGRVLKPITNREAIEGYFAAQPAPDVGDTLLVSSGDGAFEQIDPAKADAADADR